MKKLYNALIILAIPALFLIFTSEIGSTSGSPGGKTGSPGDQNQNCTGCHMGTATTEQLWIQSPELLTQGYNSGQTYNMLVIGLNSDPQKFGFEATAEAAGGIKVGTFIPGPDGRTKLANNNKSVTHTAAGTVPLTGEGTVWNFQWTAPETTTGNITFYAAINVANGNGANSGDQIKLSTFTISPAVGINDNFHDASFNVYPNPAEDFINVISSQKLERIQILNLIGQVVYTSEPSAQASRIDLSDFQKGIYFIKAGKQTERIIIK